MTISECIKSQFEEEGVDEHGKVLAVGQQLCQVCEDISDSQHFGAASCRACAAFFRRTISRRLRYVCRFEDKCKLSKSCRAICKSCRLVKCIQVGMTANAVRSRLQTAEDTHHLANDLPKFPQKSHHLSNDNGVATLTGQPIFEPFLQTGSSKVLEDIVRLKESIHIHVKETQLSNEYPTLAKILLGYEHLECQRGIRYNRMRESNGNQIRMFVEKTSFDLFIYWKNLQNEIEWMADLLLYFDQYQQLPLMDKLILFRNFWILFIILERNFDTFNVLNLSDCSLDDSRFVFANGEIIDMDKCEYDYSRIGNAEMQAKMRTNHRRECPLKPWFKRSVREVLPFMRQLRPQPMEMAFCFGLMFWRVSAEISQKLSSEATGMAHEVVECLYRELANFYAKQMPGVNQVARIAELGRLIAVTEILALQRKEEMILARTFQAFTVDIYMEEVFGRAC